MPDREGDARGNAIGAGWAHTAGTAVVVGVIVVDDVVVVGGDVVVVDSVAAGSVDSPSAAHAAAIDAARYDRATS